VTHRNTSSTSNGKAGFLILSVILALVKEYLHSFLDLGRLKEETQWSLTPSSVASTPLSHFGLTMSTGTEGIVQMDETIRKLQHETYAVNEMNDDVYADVLSDAA